MKIYSAQVFDPARGAAMAAQQEEGGFDGAYTFEGRWADLNGLIDDQVLNTYAVVGATVEVAAKIAARCQGKVERISPVMYQPDVPLLAAREKSYLCDHGLIRIQAIPTVFG